MPGVRAYLRYLARRNEDPKVSATIVNRSGPLIGELLRNRSANAILFSTTGYKRHTCGCLGHVFNPALI